MSAAGAGLGASALRAVLVAAWVMASGLAAEGVRAQAADTPGDAETLFAQAERLLASGQPSEAAARLQQAIAVDPRHWKSLCRLGEIHAAAGRNGEAEKLLRAGVDVKPDAGSCLSRLAQVLLVAGRTTEAEPFLVRADQALPGDEAVSFNLGRLYETTGRLPQAIESYRKNLAAAPNGRRAAEACLKLARLLWGEGRPVEAAEYYRGFLQRRPEKDEVRAELASVLFAASQYDASLSEYEQVIAAGHADAKGFANAGAICLLRMDLPRAIDFLGRAVSAEPHGIPPRISLATALALSDRHERAVEVLGTVTADDPENGRAWFLLSQSYARLGRAEESGAAFRRHQEIHEKALKDRMSGRPQAHP